MITENQQRLQQLLQDDIHATDSDRKHTELKMETARTKPVTNDEITEIYIEDDREYIKEENKDPSSSENEWLERITPKKKPQSKEKRDKLRHIAKTIYSKLTPPKVQQSQKFPDNRCPTCLKRLRNGVEVQKHIERIHLRIKNMQCDACPFRCYKKYDLLLHWRNRHMEKQHLVDTLVLCPICGCKLKNSSDLRRHTNKKHLKMKRFRCSKCNYTSYERKSMQMHEKTHLPSQLRDRFPCDQCNALLSTKHTLKTHKDSVHIGIKPWSCQCGKSFAQKSTLEKHIKSVHENIREFECSVCLKKFSSAPYLTMHKELMHSAEGEKPKYPCDICGNVFSTLLAMKSHTKIHSDPQFECHWCQRKFHHKTKLLDHMEKHETLPYSCPHCPRSFRRESKLNSHFKVVHFKEKTTYRCELCNSTFTRRTTYRDHVIRQHRKDIDPAFERELIERIMTMKAEEQQ